MRNATTAFKILEDGYPISISCLLLSRQTAFDIKIAFTQKARKMKDKYKNSESLNSTHTSIAS